MKRLLAGLIATPLLAGGWDARLAADYLDQRQKAWFEWRGKSDPGGPCVSCHTGTPYLLARPALRRALGESAPTSYETGLVNGFRARVDLTDPLKASPAFSKEPGASQAMGVETIHSALFLALEDQGKASLSPEAGRAFDRLWSKQIRDGESKGAWEWFSLNLDPWEAPESRFYGAAVASAAVAATPKAYRNRADVKERVADLNAYLKRAEASQPLHNRLMLLWTAKNKALVEEAFAKQNSDGGWTMESLGPFQVRPGAPPQSGGNSYATAFAAYSLLKAVKPGDPRIKRALDWLRARQDPESGAWMAESMNKNFKPGSMMALFMRDAATSYAALALAEAEAPRKK